MIDCIMNQQDLDIEKPKKKDNYFSVFFQLDG